MKTSDENLKIKRVRVPALDAILGRPFYVLDKGFVRAIDYMGSDESIVQAARVSYGKGTRKVHEDEGLIRYLMRHRHTTPFEMCEIKFHVRVPMDCWRQWIRHRTANVNEYSTRYSEAIDAAQKTSDLHWRTQSGKNRQGSGAYLSPEVGAGLSMEETALQVQSRMVYKRRLEAGVAREQARKDLPLSTYTEAYWKIDLHNLLHFLALRLDRHAQLEIRRYAEAIEWVLARWCPITWKAWHDYRFGSVHLSVQEQKIIKLLADGQVRRAQTLAAKTGYISQVEVTPGKLDSCYKLSRLGRELQAKLERLGLGLPLEVG